MTFSDRPLQLVSVDPAGIFSDHALVTCVVPVTVGQDDVVERIVRGWRRVDREVLRSALQNSPLCHPVSEKADVDELFAVYDSVLTDIADRLAPLHSIRRRSGHLAPWFDDRCRQARRQCRRLERRYRRTGTDDDRRRWIEGVRNRFQLYRTVKQEYWLNRLSQHGRSSSPIWRSLSSLFGRKRDIAAPNDYTAEDFASFFARKVDTVRAATADKPPPPSAAAAHCSLSTFHELSEADVRRLIMSSSIKSSTLDPLPTFLLREFVDVLLPYVARMVNSSLRQGRLPDSQKHAIVTPLLKRPGLDTADMANYRPVSNVTFMSKIVERAVNQQLQQYLTDNDLLPRYQSAYRRHHSTETAMLRVLSDVLTAADAQKVTMLSLLDLSAAFDCVDHQILLQRLRHDFGLTDTVLAWMTSFVTGRSQQVVCKNQLSTVQPVQNGVPQGSVLGPILFVLYTAEIGRIVARHGLMFHQYADDCQIYVATSVTTAHSAVDQLSRCIHDVEVWMSASRLRLNASKTQVLWLGSRYNIDRLTVHDVQVVTSTVGVVSSARDLGVVIDSQLSMADHVASVCRSAYYHLRQIRPALQSLTRDAAKTLVQAFISSRLDYCNSVCYGIADKLLQRLQSVQNAAARLVTRTGRREHISPVLRELHWLPVRRRLDFKLATLMFKSLHGCAPLYLSDACQSTRETSHRLRSSSTTTYVIPRTRTRLGDRAFDVAGPRLWNNLPASLRSTDSIAQFRKQLKTYLFRD